MVDQLTAADRLTDTRLTGQLTDRVLPSAAPAGLGLPPVPVNP
ncbi:hypothetical protein SCANM63S_05403 [Streptomyces canarius]